MHVHAHIQDARNRGLLKDVPGPGGTAGGYTVYELLVVVSIMAIVAMASAISYHRHLPDYNLSRAALQLTGDLRNARVEAISHNAPVRINISPEDKQYTIWSDQNTNGLIDAGEETSRNLHDVYQLEMGLAGTTGIFRARGGFSSSEGHWDIMLYVEQAGKRYVRVLPSGQVEWTDTSL